MSSRPFNACSQRCRMVAAAVLVYFVLFPEDVEALVAPIRTVLGLTHSVSLGLYGVAAVALVCWAFGGRVRADSPQDRSPVEPNI